MASASSNIVPAERRSRAILRNNDLAQYTTVQLTDARTALTKGMAEYLSQLEIQFGEGRLLSFQKVFDTWADSEENADYPGAAVYSDEPGEYDASKLTDGEPHRPSVVPSENVYLVSSCELVLEFMIDVWASDPVARMGLVAMVEEALEPTDFRYGLLLELPHYFNERASYEKISVAYLDSEDTAQQKIRRAQIKVRGRVPVVRLKTAPGMVPRVRVKVVDR